MTQILTESVPMDIVIAIHGDNFMVGIDGSRRKSIILEL